MRSNNTTEQSPDIKIKQSNPLLSRLSNPSETSALTYRVKTAKNVSKVTKSMVNYDQIYIHSVPEVVDTQKQEEIRKSIVIETLT